VVDESYYVIGGIQRSDKLTREYHRYKKGIIIKVNPQSGDSEIVYEHTTKPEHCAWDDDPSILFKSAHLEDGLLYLCTQTEVLVLKVDGFETVCHITHPYMNDVHHVRPSKTNTLIVTSTGLDAVFEFDLDGNLLTEWSVLERGIWDRFSRDVDYRKVVTTKPHDSHPNFSFYIGDQLWVTRLSQLDAISLTGEEKRIPIDIERPHDGVVFEDKVYFTTIDGNVLAYDTSTLERVEHHDLNKISSKFCALGWCRGILNLDSGHAIIGFSRLRKTKWEQNKQWLKYSMNMTKDKPEEPTRIAKYDLASGKLDWEFNLEPLGVGEVFSIFKA
jgi:hypothetical protein